MDTKIVSDDSSIHLHLMLVFLSFVIPSREEILIFSSSSQDALNEEFGMYSALPTSVIERENIFNYCLNCIEI